MDFRYITDKLELRAIVSSLREDFRADRAGWNVLKEAEMLHFRTYFAWVLFDSSGVPLSINHTAFGKRKKNAWEPYANFYLAFTRPSCRKAGYASKLARHVETDAVERGCVRLKALAGTTPGLRLHLSLGHQLWAITDQREVVVDTPLVPDVPEWVGGRPPNARKWNERTVPYTPEELRAELGEGGLRYECAALPTVTKNGATP